MQPFCLSHACHRSERDPYFDFSPTQWNIHHTHTLVVRMVAFAGCVMSHSPAIIIIFPPSLSSIPFHLIYRSVIWSDTGNISSAIL